MSRRPPRPPTPTSRSTPAPISTSTPTHAPRSTRLLFSISSSLAERDRRSKNFDKRCITKKEPLSISTSRENELSGFIRAHWIYALATSHLHYLRSLWIHQSSDSKFTQQELPACKPILTPQWVISVFALIGTSFIPIGIAALFASNKVVEIVDRYEEVCLPKNITDKALKLAYIQDPTIPKNCTRHLRVPKDMDAPIYVYYQLDNFYQNHRRYVKSRNDEQLRDPKKANTTDGCDPEKNTGNGAPIVPCGLIAWSLFNDTYSFTRGNKQLEVNKDISWKSDRDHKFGKDVFPKNFQNGALIGGGKLDPNKSLSEQEDLIVWMRTAALPTFRKLYGRIEVDLKANDTISVDLENNYNTYSFGGKKKLVLSTTTWIGGKNNFLGIAYLTVGGFCFFLSLVFTVVYLVKPR